MAYPNPNAPLPPIPSQGLGVPVAPPQGRVPVQPQGRVPVQPQRGMPMQPPRGRSMMDPRSRTEGMQDYTRMANQDPQRLAQALKGGVSPTSSGEQPSSGIGNMAMNLDAETRKELTESREPPIQETIEETEDVTIDNRGIGNLASQFLGNNLPQLDGNMYAGMEKNEIRAAAGGGLMGLAVEDEFSGMVEGDGHG